MYARCSTTELSSLGLSALLLLSHMARFGERPGIPELGTRNRVFASLKLSGHLQAQKREVIHKSKGLSRSGERTPPPHIVRVTRPRRYLAAPENPISPTAPEIETHLPPSPQATSEIRTEPEAFMLWLQRTTKCRTPSCPRSHTEKRQRRRRRRPAGVRALMADLRVS